MENRYISHYLEWNFGVFYATDANSVDQRCRNIESSQTYDCAGGWLDYDGTWKPDASRRGSGYYTAGNPYANPAWGGGTGCHAQDPAARGIDQADAIDPARHVAGRPRIHSTIIAHRATRIP